jgi:hypothetical protein
VNALQETPEMVGVGMMAVTVRDPMNRGCTQRTTNDDTVLSWAAWETMGVGMVMVEDRLPWMQNGKARYTQRVSNFT